MSDPRENEGQGNQSDPPPEQRKGVSPLIWILLLLALLALGWWFYNRSAQTGLDTTPATTTTEPAITSEQEVAAQAERERAAANERRRQQRAAEAKREAAKPKGPADREVSPVARVQPDYPPAAYRAGEEGTVVLRVDVDASGNPTNVGISKRSGSRELDRAAQRAVRQWKFKPAIKGGKQVAAVVEVPVDFRLERQ